jgi:tetratricopeptide (TPR) repeat protein
MQKAVTDSERTIAVLSPDYLGSRFGEAEWRVAFAADPTGERRKLIPVRVSPFKPTGLLRTRVYVDLVDRGADEALRELLRGVEGGRPTTGPAFPGKRQPGFPGGGPRQAAAQPAAADEMLVGRLPAPFDVLGRRNEVDRLARNLLARHPRPTPVLGPPGIGKSAVCVAALHRPRVADRFANRRYFVRCEGARSAAAALTMIASSLGIRLGTDDPLPQVVAALEHVPAVLVLDNADTPWEEDPEKTVELLNLLAAVPGLALAASIRGQERPRGVHWQDSIQVSSLEPSHARRLFLKIAGQKFANDPTLGTLMDAQDGVPLTITLLAHVAQWEPTLDKVWEQRKALLQDNRAGDGKLSREDSFELAINSSRTTPEARRLLALLGILPDGVAHDDLDQLLPGIGNPAASSLRRVGLASDDERRLRTLQPIRDHVNSRYRPSEGDRGRAVAHYRALAYELGARAGVAGGAEASERLSAELGNVDAMLHLGFQDDDPTPSIRAAISVASFMRFSGLGSTRLLESARTAARRIGDTDLEARTLKGIGHVALVRSDLDEAVARYTEALRLFERTGNEKHQAICTKSLGHVQLAHGRLDEARKSYRRALKLFDELEVGYPLGRADTIAGLGDVAFRSEDYDAAQRHYEEAQVLYKQLGHVRGIANCMADRGEIAVVRKHYDAARNCFDQARPLYGEVGHIHGTAKCELGLAHVALAQREYERARTFFQLAERLYIQVGARKEQAWSIAGLGDVGGALGSREDAWRHYNDARELFSGINDEHGIEQMTRRLELLDQPA